MPQGSSASEPRNFNLRRMRDSIARAAKVISAHGAAGGWRRRGTFAGALSATVIAGASLGAQAPNVKARHTIKASVDVVTIQASVRDARGRTVQGLAPSDFEIRDNGLLRPILSLRADQTTPVSVALLVDMSGSMQVGQKGLRARQAYEALTSHLRPDVDEAAVFTFDSSLHERLGFTNDGAAIERALDDFDPFGTTSLYDATAATARRLTERPAAHRAVVILTDGIDTSSRLSAAEVSGLASSIDVPVYVVATIAPLDEHLRVGRVSTETEEADLQNLAEWTGGRVLYASTPAQAQTAASSLMDELRHQYVLAIEAASNREWRRLDIRVRRHAATVTARSGYFGG